ncbi:MAG: hypothetical protein ACRC5H_03035 [Treponemataceae bacterium]
MATSFAQTSPSMPVLSPIESPLMSKPAMPTIPSPFDTANQNNNNQSPEAKPEKSQFTAQSMAKTLISNSLGQNTTDLVQNLLIPQNQTNSNDILLQQIIVQLETLQKKVDNQEISTTTKNQNGNFLRFQIANHNLLESFETSYFSKKNQNGDFLISVDRNYMADQKKRSETFYLLLKKIDTNEYDVSIDVAQDYKNEKSFLYRLANEKNMRFTQFGDTYKLNYTMNNLRWDILFKMQD